MDLRRRLLAHTWAQLALVLMAVVLLNTWAARSFMRVDLTQDKLYSLDLATRVLVNRVERPLTAKVYFTRGLQAPYNNHEQVLVDTLEDMRAYSRGLMEIEVTDPTNLKELEAEARRFGIEPIQYRYRGEGVTEMRKVFMGVALVYGDQQQVLPAVTDIATIEYDLARALKGLVTDEEPRTIGWTVSHGEPDLFGTQGGPLATIRSRLAEDYNLKPVELGGEGGIPDDIDALYVVGPQKPLSMRALYQLDQYVMRGGAMALFVTNTRADMRTLRPQSIYHGLEPLIGHYGVQLNRDLVVDRTMNGMMRFPVRRGQFVQQVPVNYPLIPKVTDLSAEHPVVRGLDSMLFPFASSLTVADPLPTGIEATVLATSSPASGRIKGVVTIDPGAFKMVAPGEERGAAPMVVTLTGPFDSYFADKDIPTTTAASGRVVRDDPATKLRQGAPARLVLSGSADFVANNIAFMRNLTDWMAQDESLIGIRSKTAQLPALDPMEPLQARLLKLGNLLGGSVLLLIFGLGRWLLRRASGGYKPRAKATGEAA